MIIVNIKELEKIGCEISGDMIRFPEIGYVIPSPGGDGGDIDIGAIIVARIEGKKGNIVWICHDCTEANQSIEDYVDIGDSIQVGDEDVWRVLDSQGIPYEIE